jgi:hypothetical protein
MNRTPVTAKMQSFQNSMHKSESESRVCGWKDLQNGASDDKSSVEDGEISGGAFEIEPEQNVSHQRNKHRVPSPSSQEELQ